MTNFLELQCTRPETFNSVTATVSATQHQTIQVTQQRMIQTLVVAATKETRELVPRNQLASEVHTTEEIDLL